jgi:acyl-homoserine-lactone acylase
MKKILLLLTALGSCLSTYSQKLIIPDFIRRDSIQIVRDSFGVAHIFAPTDAEVAYGLGWAAAEDDFNTLQWGLLVSKYQLAKHLGVEGAAIDYAAQLMRIRRTVDERYDSEISPEFKKILRAAAASVNVYAKKHPEEVLVKTAFPATEKDILCGYMLSMALMSGVDGAIRSVVDGNAPEVSFADKNRGSNAIAMNSKLTSDGKVYLDINSHQPLEGPLSWYEVHLSSGEGWNIHGSTFHGGVTIFHGANENLGWAHTVNDVRLVDVFQLQQDPRKKNHYLMDGISKKLETDHARLIVKLGKKGKFCLPVFKKIWWSDYGATYKNKKGWFAVRLGANMKIGAAEQWYRMNKARNFTEFRKALDMQQIAMQTVTYADRYDTIYNLSNALIPKRNPLFDWNTTVPGNTSATCWKEFYPVSALPQVLNPPCGYVFNMNNTAFDASCATSTPDSLRFPKEMKYGRSNTNRSLRFHELIDGKKKVSWDEFLAMKYDITFPVNFQFLKNFDVSDMKDMSETEYPDIADCIRSIRRYDRTHDIADTNATIMLKTLYNLYNDSNGEMEKKFREDKAAKYAFFAQSIRKAKSDLVKYYGKINVPLGTIQRHIRGNVSMPISGGPDMINAVICNPTDSARLKMWLGESFIQLVRFDKDGAHIETVSPYGASNKPGSPHYTDQMKMFVNHQRKKMSLKKAEVMKMAKRIYHPD